MPTRPTALVLGASRGLGLLVAEQLLARGHAVYGCARGEAELLSAARLMSAAVPGAQFVPRTCDVRDQDAVSALVDEVVGAEGGVDVAVHVAGVVQVGHAEALTLGH